MVDCRFKSLKNRVFREVSNNDHFLKLWTVVSKYKKFRSWYCMKFKSKQFISRFMAVVLLVCMLMGSGFATVGSYIMNPVIVKAATEISILNLPDYPSNGQKYWVIFKEGYRNSRIEMSTCNANASDGVWIKWNRSLTLQGAQTDGQVNQYRLSDENSWEQIGTYGRFTDWATEVIASNLDVYDSYGNIVLKGNSYSIDVEGYDEHLSLDEELVYKTKLYTSDGGYTYERVLERLNEKLARDDIAAEDKIAMLNNFYKLFNVTDIQEGTAYCIEAMNGKRAYDFLTNDENFLAYQFKNYLQNTAPGTIARGLMITDGWIFNNELKQWIDPRTYITQETVDIKNYKAMLLSFMNYEAETGVAGDVSEVVGYADNVKTHIEYFAKNLDEAAKKNIKKDLADIRANSKNMTTAQVRQEMKKIWKKYQLEGTIENGKKVYHVKDFNELSKALEISGDVFQIAVTSIDDIMDILNVESKLETIEKYRKFLELVANGKDYLPGDMVIAVNQLLNEAILPYFRQFTAFIYDEFVCMAGVFDVSETFKNKLTDKLKAKYPKLFEGDIAKFTSTFGDAVAVIEISAVVTNAITNVGTTINDAAYVEAYAYLGQYFDDILRDAKDKFNANQTVENAWSFYDLYNLLFRIRACGEISYLKMCDDSPVTWILSGVGFKFFDITDRKKYVEDTFEYMNEYCFFGLENADQILESHKFAQKAVIKCPVDVEIYDNSGKLVYTIFDGKEIDDTNTLGRFICKYDPKLGEYIKIVCLNNPDKYTIKNVGVDCGNVNIETAVVGSDNAVTASKVAGLPIEKNGIITLDIKTGNYTDDQNGDGSNEYTGKLQKTDTEKIIPVKSIKLSDETVDLKVGEKKVVGAIINPTNATFTDVVWESSDESIAVVENGAIQGISAGEAKITVSTSDRKIISSCTVTVKSNRKFGDTNGDGKATIADSLMIARYEVKLRTLTDEQLAVSDVNYDGKVTIADALKIARYEVKLINSL